MVNFIVDRTDKTTIRELSNFLFGTLCRERLGDVAIDRLTEEQWRPIASEFSIWDQQDWSWEEQGFAVFMGAEVCKRFGVEWAKRHGAITKRNLITTATLPEADKIVKLLRVKDGKAKSELNIVRDLVVRYVDEATGNSPVSTMTETQFVFNPERFLELIEHCQTTGEVCFDFETKPKFAGLKKKDDLKKASLDFNRSLPTMLGISFQVGSGWVIPLYHHHSVWDIGKDDEVEIISMSASRQGDRGIAINQETLRKYDGTPVLESEDEELFSVVFNGLLDNIEYAKTHGYSNLITDFIVPNLNKVFADYDIRKVAHNFKFDYKIGRKLGIEFNGRFDDTILLDHYLREDREHGLKDIASRYFPEFSGYEEDIDYANDDIFKLGEYCAKDNDLTLRLSYILENELLLDPPSYRCYRSLERLKTAMLAEMEWDGMRIDRKVMADTLEKVNAGITAKESFILSHPIVRRFIAAKSTEGSDAKIAVLSEKISNAERQKLEALQAKEPPKEGTKARETHNKKLELLTGKQYYDPQYPYSNIANWAKDRDRLEAGEGKEKFEFNLNSTQQLGELIYTHPTGLKHRQPVTIKTRKNPATGKSEKVKQMNPDTGKDQLLQLKDDTGLIEAIVELGILGSLKGTFLEGIADTMDFESCVHSSFSTVKTHRLSSNNPNLQNIPSRTKVKELKELVAAIKRMFIPHPDSEDYVFFQADLSQAELRWIAYLWQIRSMLKAFQQDKDLHILASCNANGLTEDDYWQIKKTDTKRADDLRQVGKANNFGLCFEASPMGYQHFAKTQYGLDLTLAEAEHHHASFFKLHPDIPKAHRLYHAKALKYGYVRTASGVKRHTPNIPDANPRSRREEGRKSVNSPVQGSSGQAMMFSLVVYRMRMRMLYGELWKQIAKVVNSVHDSAVGWAHKLYAMEVLKWLQKSMNCPPTLEYFDFDFTEIMMKTDVETGQNWKDLAKFEFNN